MASRSSDAHLHYYFRIMSRTGLTAKLNFRDFNPRVLRFLWYKIYGVTPGAEVARSKTLVSMTKKSPLHKRRLPVIRTPSSLPTTNTPYQQPTFYSNTTRKALGCQTTTTITQITITRRRTTFRVKETPIARTSRPPKVAPRATQAANKSKAQSPRLRLLVS